MSQNVANKMCVPDKKLVSPARYPRRFGRTTLSLSFSDRSPAALAEFQRCCFIKSNTEREREETLKISRYATRHQNKVHTHTHTYKEGPQLVCLIPHTREDRNLRTKVYPQRGSHTAVLILTPIYTHIYSSASQHLLLILILLKKRMYICCGDKSCCVCWRGECPYLSACLVQARKMNPHSLAHYLSVLARLLLAIRDTQQQQHTPLGSIIGRTTADIGI